MEALEDFRDGSGSEGRLEVRERAPAVDGNVSDRLQKAAIFVGEWRFGGIKREWSPDDGFPPQT